MSVNLDEMQQMKQEHSWLKQLRVAFVPGAMTPLLSELTGHLRREFERQGHTVQRAPDNQSDVLITSAPFGEPVGWRDALLFSMRRRFDIEHSPTVFTLVHVTPQELEEKLAHFERALRNEPPDTQDFEFAGLAPDAPRVLIEQGLRGGPILALERVLQAQTKSIRIVLVVGEEDPDYAYHFDLVGSHPRSPADDREAFYRDIVLRIVTAGSTKEVTEHEAIGEPIDRATWERLATVDSMRNAALELDKRDFFTDMVRIMDLVQVPALADAVASQYSEGCFATWEPDLDALVATVTGSARPVDKGDITEDDVAVIVGLRPGGSGALVRHVEGKRNDPPSSEAVEMMDMDQVLPTIELGADWDLTAEVPVVRSKLHGHRAVGAFDPEYVEHVHLDPPYYHYLVSCATEAQAQGIKQAFARSQALQNPDDPRPLVFTVLPGHGCVIAEKWAPGKRPFELMWQAMDSGQMEIINRIPQGPLTYEPADDGRLHLKTGV